MTESLQKWRALRQIQLIYVLYGASIISLNGQRKGEAWKRSVGNVCVCGGGEQRKGKTSWEQAPFKLHTDLTQSTENWSLDWSHLAGGAIRGKPCWRSLHHVPSWSNIRAQHGFPPFWSHWAKYGKRSKRTAKFIIMTEPLLFLQSINPAGTLSCKLFQSWIHALLKKIPLHLKPRCLISGRNRLQSLLCARPHVSLDRSDQRLSLWILQHSETGLWSLQMSILNI